MAGKLDADEIDRALSELSGWELSPDRTAIERSYKFKNFSAAWAFLSRCALLAEKMDHHPDISNSYSSVRISLTSHDAGGLTDRDFRMARAINGLD